jgi:hypothetical protein
MIEIHAATVSLYFTHCSFGRIRRFGIIGTVRNVAERRRRVSFADRKVFNTPIRHLVAFGRKNRHFDGDAGLDVLQLRRVPASLLVAFLSLAPGSATTALDMWVPETTDPAAWRDLRAAFKEELRPDDPQTLKPHQIALRYRYIARVARAADVCLVIIGQRESKRAPPGTGFIAFSYDLKSHHKTLITKRPLLGWRSLMWTRLEKGLHQELLFEHVSCFECESETYLSSIFLDLNRRAWTLRAWPIPDEPTNIPVGAWSIGFDDASRTTCLFKIANFFGAERALGVWCPEVLEDRREPEERVRLYTITDGEPATRTPDATEVRSMMRVLCRSHSSHVLCRPRP